jgi:hydroxyethylthiazole kinase-like uncharacterized protein yjeF
MNKPVLALTRKQAVKLLPKRPHDSHKGQFGNVVIIGGASGTVGAALMAGRAALKLGAGSIHVGLLAENAPVVDLHQPELMLHAAATALRLPNVTVMALGCGLGREPVAQKMLYDALQFDIPLVLDADALNILAKRPDLRSRLIGRKNATVMTPHPGEAARLLGSRVEDIQADRMGAVRELAAKFASSVVLKGAESLCVTHDGKIYLNQTGNPGMSSAGMGDVLTGMIAAFIGQGMPADDALLFAVHLHGAAGDAMAEQSATIGMSASEVTDWARWLLNQWIKSPQSE